MFSDVMIRVFSVTISSSFATISSLASSISGSDLITTSGSTLLMRGLGGLCDGLVMVTGVRGILGIELPIGVNDDKRLKLFGSILIVVPLMLFN